MDDRDVELIKAEITNLAAETLALKAIVVQLADRIGVLDPVLGNAVSKSFEGAATFAESFSRARGKAAGHLPETLQIIEQLRSAVTFGGKLKRGV